MAISIFAEFCLIDSAILQALQSNMCLPFLLGLWKTVEGVGDNPSGIMCAPSVDTAMVSGSNWLKMWVTSVGEKSLGLNCSRLEEIQL